MENPKKAEGLKKVPYSYVPAGVVAGLAVAMYEGKKYGRSNYRVVGNIAASTYYDAERRHMDSFWEGRDIDPQANLHEVFKAMACLAVLADAIMTGNFDDDRPPAKLPKDWLEKFNEVIQVMNTESKFVEPYTEKNYAARITPAV